MIRGVRASSIGCVGDLAFLVVQVVLNDTDRHAEEAVDAAHPLRVAACEVVVHRDDVDAFSGEGVQIRGQGGDERLAFARLHFGDPAAMEDDPTDELDVEVPHVECAAARLANDGKRLGQEIPELCGLRAELFVGKRLNLGFFGVDYRDERLDALQLAVVGRADNFCKECVD